MDEESKENGPSYGWGMRHVQVALIFSMVFVMYTISMAPATAIVAMTDNSTSPNPNVPTFTDWTDQSFILFSYYLGYAGTQLTGGPLARKYGFKWIMVWSMVLCAITSFLIPFATVKFGSIGFMGCFFFQGLMQGCVIPMLPIFISIWLPVSETTKFGTIIFSCKTLGTVSATELTGLLSSSWWGWPSAFYLFGVFGLVWSIFMAIIAEDDPMDCKYISKSELEYIKHMENRHNEEVPWAKIAKNRSTWATWIAHIGIMLTVRLAAVESPTYINRVLGFSVVTSSNTISLALILAYCNTYLISYGSHYFISKDILSIGTTRKICNSLAAYGSATIWLMLAFVSVDNHNKLYFIMVLFICLNASYAGYNINYNDLSPNFCSHIYGLGGFVSTCLSWTPPVLVQTFVTDQTDAKQWRIVFVLAALTVSTTNTYFVFNGSGKVQQYDDVPKESIEAERLGYERLRDISS